MARNGYLAEDGIRLVTVEDNDQLVATAAASFAAMRAAAAADGVSLWIVEPAGAYRSAWVQNDMVDNPSRYNLNPASVIGFSRYGQSHGWGNRVDVNSAAVPWMLRNASRFGWSREYGAKDPNHFKHDGVTAVSGAGAGGGSAAPNDPPISTIYEEEDDMAIRLIAHVQGGVTEEVAAICSDFENGYIIEKGGTPAAAALLRTYSPKLDGTPHNSLDRAGYLAVIEEAKKLRAAVVAGRSIGGTVTVPAGVATTASVNEAADRVIASMPTKVTLPEGTLS